MKPNAERLEYLVKRRDGIKNDIVAARTDIEALQRKLNRLQQSLSETEDDIQDFKQECFVSPKIEVLPIPSDVRRILNKAGIVTIYDLKYAIRTDTYIPGIGDTNRIRLVGIVGNYYRGLKQASEQETTDGIR